MWINKVVWFLATTLPGLCQFWPQFYQKYQPDLCLTTCTHFHKLQVFLVPRGWVSIPDSLVQVFPLAYYADAQPNASTQSLSLRQGFERSLTVLPWAYLGTPVYFFWKLLAAECNYDVEKHDFLPVKLVQFLSGPITKSGVYPRARRLNSRQARWALFFTQCNFTLYYHPESKNGKLRYRYHPVPRLQGWASDSGCCTQHIVSGCGHQFVSWFWKEFCRLLGAFVSLCSGFHPEANIRKERRWKQPSAA